MDRSWMYRRYNPIDGGISEEFLMGVRKFISFARTTETVDGIRCPCRQCANTQFFPPKVVSSHLNLKGFVKNYHRWISHGETPISSVVTDDASTSHRSQTTTSLRTSSSISSSPGIPNSYRTNFLSNYNSPPPDDEPELSDHHSPDEPESGTAASYEVPSNNSENGVAGPNDHIGSTRDFWKALEEADEPLWNDCEETVMSCVSELLKIKSEFNMSEKCYNKICQWASRCMPRDHKLPSNYYHSKKILSELGLSVVRIDMCPQGCMLYWKDDVSRESCKFCNESRFKSKKDGKMVPIKQLRYLPLTPRLQRLYASTTTAKHMRWHHEHQVEEGIMCHPSDSECWRHFDSKYPDFSFESCNVRLALSADGFTPFGQSGRVYSCWPVIVTPYNLPPSMCLKAPYMFLTLIIPGPKNPKKLIDVCLQPLIDELKMLWSQGVPTRDVIRNDEIFQMRAALMWTINDFPAYGMLSGWSTAGLMACPDCKENTKSFYLRDCKKCSWFDDQRRFLELHHPFRRNKRAFTKNRQENSLPPKQSTGEEIWNRVKDLPTMIDDPFAEIEGYRKTHKWTKQSIFWQLPYWKTLLIRHNLDVMHIEKNVFDNTFNTVMGIEGKSKDMLNARKDMKNICNRRDLEVDEAHVGPIPKACYTVTKDERKQVCDWVKSLKFPDGYASNIGRCVQVADNRLIGMKSHDCHVFMQRLLPIAFREFLPSHVWGPITELSQFFQSLCSPTLSIAQMEELDKAIPIILCKLEKIFPPSFFDSMEHLLVHLPKEAKIGGPNKYRWMYSFERFLHLLKQKVGNKAHVEASICSSYVVEEMSTLADHYFKSKVSSKRKRHKQADDTDPALSNAHSYSIFNYPGRGFGDATSRWLTEEEAEKHAIETFILMNCSEVDFYTNLFSEQVGGADDKIYESSFAPWFYSHVSDPGNEVTDPLIKSLSFGPKAITKSWTGYIINGYKFHTVQRGENKSTMNSGVWVKGISAKGEEVDYYGLLEEIIQIEYSGTPAKEVVLFKCRWFDPKEGTLIDKKYDLVEVNPKRIYKSKDPYILAQQAKQVYYAKFPGAKRARADWLAACKTNARSNIEQRWTDIEEVYQPEEPVAVPIVNADDDSENLHAPSGENTHVDSDVEVINEIDDHVLHFSSDDEVFEDDEFNEEEERVNDDEEEEDDDF